MAKTILSWLGVILLLVATFPGCERKTPEKPIVTHLKAKLIQLETQFAEYEDKIRRASDDAGRNRLNSERELLKSRIERVKAILKREAPEAIPAEAKSSESHH